jgi:hypothetical protein
MPTIIKTGGREGEGGTGTAKLGIKQIIEREEKIGLGYYRLY